MTKNTPEFERGFVREILQANTDDPLVFIEILARAAEADLSLRASMIAALKVKGKWYTEQAAGLSGLIALNKAVAASGKGEGN